MFRSALILTVCLACLAMTDASGAQPLKVGVFAIDASPPVGSPLAYDPTKGIAHPLSCRGVVILGEGRPIVVCAVDWIGIGNDGQVEFRRSLADAAGTEARSRRRCTRCTSTTHPPATSRSTGCSRPRDQRRVLRYPVRPRRDRPRGDGRSNGDIAGERSQRHWTGRSRNRASGVESACSGR